MSRVTCSPLVALVDERDNRIAITTAQIIFTCAGGLQIFENQRWLLVRGHAGLKDLDTFELNQTQPTVASVNGLGDVLQVVPGGGVGGQVDPGPLNRYNSVSDSESESTSVPRTFFEKLYLTVITVACVGYVVNLKPMMMAAAAAAGGITGIVMSLQCILLRVSLHWHWQSDVPSLT